MLDGEKMDKYKYFSKNEMKCPCCGRVDMDDSFMQKLNAIRSELGRPMFATSGYRCAEYNKSIGGHRNSAHMHGKAVDIKRIDGAYTREVSDLASKYNMQGIEIGSGHTHLDEGDRNVKVIWGGKSK